MVAGANETMSRIEVYMLAEKAVRMKSKYGHSDVGDVLVRMLQGVISTDEAYTGIAGLMKDYAK